MVMTVQFSQDQSKHPLLYLPPTEYNTTMCTGQVLCTSAMIWELPVDLRQQMMWLSILCDC